MQTGTELQRTLAVKSCCASRGKKNMLEDHKEQLVKTSLKRGKQGRYFSTRGGMITALKTCLCNTGSQSVAFVLGMDVTSKYVREWMVIISTTIIF